MILILTDSSDPFSNKIEEQLSNSGSRYVRLNKEDLLKLPKVEITRDTTSILIQYQGKELSLLDSTIFHRRGSFIFSELKNHQEIDINNFISKENIYLFKGMMMIANMEGRLYGNHYSEHDNRLFNTYLAKKNKLKFPATFILTKKDDLNDLLNTYSRLITKPIGDSFRGKIKGNPMTGKVVELDSNLIDEMQDEFFPVLVQEKIERAFELRVFVLGPIVESVAIFLDDNITDYRFAPNDRIRQVPYEIPGELKEKIFNILRVLGLDTASFDFIVSPEGEYYFLELNPFGMIHNNSFIEYFGLDRQVANLLTKNEG